MSYVVPYDIIAQIIDIVGENDDMILIKQLALVSHSSYQMCSKYLFATVNLHDDVPMQQASSKKGFVELLERRPEVVKYIRHLTYKLEYNATSSCSDNLLSPVLPNFLRTISFLNCLTITSSKLVDWDTVDSFLTSALLHLMHLPTIIHLDLSSIKNFPLSGLTSSKPVNLRRLDIDYLNLDEPDRDDDSQDDSPDVRGVVLPEVMPKIVEFHTSESYLLTEKLLRAKTQGGQPVFNFIDLRRLSIVSFSCCSFEDGENLEILLQKAKSLELLRFSVVSRMGFDEVVDVIFQSPTTRSLKELDLTLPLGSFSESGPFSFFSYFEAFAGNNMLEVLSLEVLVSEKDDFIGRTGLAFRKVEELLVKAGWSALRQVSFKVLIECWKADVSEALQSLPDKYLCHLPKLESIDFNYEWNIYSNASDYDNESD